MNTRNAVVSIGVIFIIVFLAVVFYSKSQWHLINVKEISEAQAKLINDTNEAEGNIKLVVLKHNETAFCNNSVDDDIDNLTDCKDPDCFNDWWCLNETV